MTPELKTIRWCHAGWLSCPTPAEGSGTYVFVYEGTPQRIIYVGTANSDQGFSARIRTHVRLLRTGGRTLWRPGNQEDVYDLMRSGRESYYRDLVENRKAWLPSDHADRDDPSFYRCLFDDVETSYVKDWLPYVEETYMQSVSLWTCELDAPDATRLESQIQIALGKAFRIGYYSGDRQNWLGRQEVKDRAPLLTCGYEFDNFPLPHQESREVLANLRAYCA